MDRAVESALIAHSVDLVGYSNGVVRAMSRILDSADANLFRELLAVLDGITPSEFKVRRLLTLLSSVRKINSQAFAKLGEALRAELALLAGAEVEFFAGMLGAQIEPGAARSVAVEQVVAAAEAQPLRGRLMSQWAESLGVARMQRIQDQIAIGFTENRTTSEIVSRLRGTRANRYTDGLLMMDRRNVEAVVRTAVSQYAQVAREQLFDANQDIITAVQWVSTLDSRTSEWCIVRDGRRYTNDEEHKPIGHPYEWLGGPGSIHWNCRSTSIPVLRIEALNKRRVRASVDGPVSGSVTYAEWIKGQSAERQREVLGASRARLMREGKYTLDRFYNNKGRYLTIEQLRTRDRETFRRLEL
jgi:hypothetical protein